MNEKHQRCNMNISKILSSFGQSHLHRHRYPPPANMRLGRAESRRESRRVSRPSISFTTLQQLYRTSQSGSHFPAYMVCFVQGARWRSVQVKLDK